VLDFFTMPLHRLRLSLVACLFNRSLQALAWAKARGGRLVWVAAVSTIMVLVPVLFEVQREGQCLNLER
jgi:uncharacterized protein (DUF2126 family)